MSDDSKVANLTRDKNVLLEWVDKAEKDRKALIDKYEKIITNLELRIEELEAPQFSKRDLEEAQEMIKNTQQKVSDDYYNNPFWVEVDTEGDLLPTLEDELVQRLDAMHAYDDPEHDHAEAENILLEALRHCGYTKLVSAFEDAQERVGFWYG